MAQYLFPRTNEAGDLVNGAVTLTFYLDAQGKNLATITTPSGGAIPGAQVNTSPTGVIPQFLGSTNGEKVLYAKVATALPGQPLLQVDGEPQSGTSLPFIGGRANVTKSTAGSAADGQTLHTWTGKVALSTTVNTTVHLPVGALADYTVAAGNSFFVTDIYASGNTANQFEVQIVDSVTGIQFYGIAKGDTAPVVLNAIETQPQLDNVVTLVFGPAAAATTAYYFVSGYEQTNIAASY